jgi:hypothetical protein
MTTNSARYVRCLPPLVLVGLAALLSSCAEDGRNLCILGYTTAPNYDTSIHTVRVPIFKNITMRDSTREGIEFQLTQAVVREIELKTPYKVVGANCDADTELTGTIRSYNKLMLNRTQLNEVREAEMDMTVEVVWRDLRTGEILSAPKKKPEPLPPLADLPPSVANPPPPLPTTVTSTATFIEELGESITTARKKNIDQIAVQIVSMMEKPW